MDGLSTVAGVVAVIQRGERVVKICGSYIKEVEGAKREIKHLQREVADVTGVLGKLSDLLDSSDGAKLSTSQYLVNDLTRCFSKLTALEKKIDPGKGQTTMTKLGLRALKWPLERGEVEGIVHGLERCKQSLNLALQVDQTYVVHQSRTL